MARLGRRDPRSPATNYTEHRNTSGKGSRTYPRGYAIQKDGNKWRPMRLGLSGQLSTIPGHAETFPTSQEATQWLRDGVENGILPER